MLANHLLFSSNEDDGMAQAAAIGGWKRGSSVQERYRGKFTQRLRVANEFGSSRLSSELSTVNHIHGTELPHPLARKPALDPEIRSNSSIVHSILDMFN